MQNPPSESLEYSIKVENYKCFKNGPQGFEKVKAINIIIGKNNSGKSSLIDLVHRIFEPTAEIHKQKMNGSRCRIELEINDTIIDLAIKDYEEHQSSGSTWKRSIYKYVLENELRQKVAIEIGLDGNTMGITPSLNFGQYNISFIGALVAPFKNRGFKRINADRNIVPETRDFNVPLLDSGENATRIIWKYLSQRNLNQNLILKHFLSSLNQIVQPDIYFKNIMVRDSDHTDKNKILGEIQFENEDGTWVYLSQMGSGIKTIILVLLNMVVIPEIEIPKKPISNYVFGFEELENNLHPSIIRRLFNFISKYANEHGPTFFITTHSSIVIDMFVDKPFAQIVHVVKREDKTKVNLVTSNFDGRYILKDLEFRASDLLLSNGVVWVEGPSDCIYLELFLTLYLKLIGNTKSLNYCIQSLSTSLWKYAGFADFDWEKIDEKLDNQLISLAKINHNNLIVIDRDDNYDDKKPSDWANFSKGTGKNKARLINELFKYNNYSEDLLESNFGDAKDGTLLFWINEMTIETYLEHFVSSGRGEFEKYFDISSDDKMFSKKKSGNNHSISKVELAAQIAAFSLENELSFSDFAPPQSSLADKIQRLYKTLKSWN
jgi:predicted ATPase